MSRRLFDIVSVLSLHLSIAAAALWARSRHAHDHWGQSTSSGRYTLHSDRGRIYLAIPPPPASAQAETQASAIVSQIRNRDVAWEVYRQPAGGLTYVTPHALPKTPLSKIDFRPGLTFRRSLLLALDDPDRFVAAHFWLIRSSLPTVVFGSQRALRDGSIEIRENGLLVTLLPASWDYGPYYWEQQSGQYSRWCDDPRYWRADMGQLASVRNFWQDQLDVRLASCRDWALVAGFLFLPLAWLCAWLVRRSRGRQGLCAECGYDLRASTGRCSECGTPIRVGAG